MLSTKVIDPVCGMDVKVNNLSINSEFGGVQYFFCSASCKHRFDANPGQYRKENNNQLLNKRAVKSDDNHCHSQSKESFELLILPINGMTCHSCARLIEQELSGLHGVNNVNVSFNSARAVVDINPAIITAKQVKATIAELGYQVLEKIA